MTPGQALYEAVRGSAVIAFSLDVSSFAAWSELPEWQRERLEAAAKAAIAAAELTSDADLKAERDEARDVVCKLLDLFGAPDDRFMQHSSVTRATLQRYAGEAGVRLDGLPK